MKVKSKYFMVVAVLLTATNNLFGQIPAVKTPKPASVFTEQNYGIPIPQVRQRNYFYEVTNSQNSNPLEMYERDKQEIQRRNAELQKILRENEKNTMSYSSIRYDLPLQLGKRGTEYYQKALDKLSEMLRGQTPLNLKSAVFTVENAYFENQLNYSDFNKAIKHLVETAKIKTMQDGHNWNNRLTKNVMLFRVMADTFDIKVPQREMSVTSYPMLYDFDDFWGKEDRTKLFVSKLLATNKGQCHSLPLLYLILCEETGTEANLAYSPSHSYIKFKDNTGNWYNLELTNGHIVTDAFIVGSGFITSEALKNKLYMEPQTKRQVIAQCINDLSMGYEHKYGYDSFIKQCIDTVLKYDPHNLGGWMMKSNYQTQLFEYVVNQVGRLHPDILKERYPQIYELLQERNTTYRAMDASGYREMPKDVYESWLKSVNEEKERREYNEKYKKVLRLIK